MGCIADTYKNYNNLAYALADEYGEAGREIFYRLVSRKGSYPGDEYNLRNQMHEYKFNLSLFYKAMKLDDEQPKDLPFVVNPLWNQPSTPSKIIHTIPSVVSQEAIIEHRSNDNYFLRYLCDNFKANWYKVANDYKIGSYNGNVIFWQIDQEGNGYAGKYVRYDGAIVNNAKEDNHKNQLIWIYDLEKNGIWYRSRCLFGEHLLSKPENKRKIVAVVRDERTAFIAAGIMPLYVWLAVGDDSMFNEHGLRCLAGRKVVAFPDAHPDGKHFCQWNEIAAGFEHCIIKVSDVLERNASLQEKESNMDIADFLLKDCCINKADVNSSLEKSFNEHPAMQTLWLKFGLELINNGD